MFQLLVVTVASSVLLSFALWAEAESDSNIYYQANQNVNSKVGNGEIKTDAYGLSLDVEGRWGRFGSNLVGDIRHLYEPQGEIFSVAEINIGHYGKTYSLEIGRRILPWNESTEQFWLLNDVNGLREFGPTDNRQEGKFGIFFSKNWGKNIGLQLYISKMHLPSLNPGYIFKKGKITSSQSWVPLPDKQMTYYDTQVPIYYRLETPAVSEVIYQNGLGIRPSYRWKSGEISGFALYKPESFWRQHVVGHMARELDQVEVTVTPTVNHHMIYGIDIAQKISKIDVEIGYKIVDPNGDFKEEFPVFGESLATVHPTFESDYFQIVPKYKQRRYFHLKSGYNGDRFSTNLFGIYSQSSDEGPGELFAGDAIKWKRGVGLLLGYKANDKFKASLNLKYDLKTEDTILKNEIIYRPAKHLQLALGAELLRSPQDESYWSSFRSNDLIYSN